ncbi:NDP-hexose 2,3-dehydratase family protein [Streptomyces sp. ME19-01-6]|uniref:NDP-hexose 2,3-dehydratase family protein n=1 Tax=Streptomyces sp. ME19-01-6 TaxID=3028686 RepID=UPI0029A7ACB5|nr:NDP-hexose 2,3-dehydratase family protein [Streptomyces sp. ME19-01-6]MDX3232328.1 NDP-hexose 2,3-dehydratase family protein [Streptomyces sp. ME19-01-6]
MTCSSPGRPTSPDAPDACLPARVARSALAVDGAGRNNWKFHQWFTEYRVRDSSLVRRIPLNELAGWRFEDGTGNLVHDTGRFFSIQGLRVRTGQGPVHDWSQPIIVQPEVGILGILVKEFDGVLHCLMQAKMEPGNRNGIQLSPTVQATRSNYTGVHGGRPVPYLEYFRDPSSRQVLADVLHSEQGSWFHRKRNRNMIVEATEDVELLDGFYWLTIGQLHALLAEDDLVNMDARTVLSCLPFADPLSGDRGALHTTGHLRSWINDARVRREVDATLTGLGEVRGWHRSTDLIAHESGLFFDVMAVDVRTGSREVGGWTQPMIEARDTGIVAFLVKRVNGVLHALVQLKAEPGFVDVVELAPTVQATPQNYKVLPAEAYPPFLDEVLGAPTDTIRFDSTLSEEGGRFFHTRSRYLIVEVAPDRDLAAHDDFRWVTMRQLPQLLCHSHYVNVQARSLIACLHSLMAGTELSD